MEEGSPENSKDLEKIHAVVVEFCDKFKYEIMRCVQCPIVLECKYPKKRLESLRAEAKKVSDDVYEEEIELDNSAENTFRAQNKRAYIFRSYIQDNAPSVLAEDRCIFERQEILVSLQKFVDAGYDIADPRVYMIIKELISNILISGRANKAFTSLGVILKKDTPAGPVYYNNPMIKAKIEFSRLIIESTEALDRILKSDVQQKAENTFTAHLMKQLRVREERRKMLIDEAIKEDDIAIRAGTVDSEARE